MRRIPTQVNVSQIVSALMVSITIFFVSNLSLTGAQIISHELRRLAISTNQFGIDALKALDKIEPPDKVLVFCPVCISSSLMMVMMGSSKYQVVSSLRHALYVWSMKPHEINRGFKDIFEHIGLNQQQQSPRAQQLWAQSDEPKAQRSMKKNKPEQEPRFDGKTDGEAQFERKRTSRDVQDHHYDILDTNQQMSLPNLIRMREFLERSPPVPWWSATSKKSSNSPRELRGPQYVAINDYHSPGWSQIATRNHSSIDNLHDSRELIDLSQMSATSNIYLQRGLSMNYNYNLLLRKYYKTVIHPVDFIRNGEETRQHINSLIAANTEGKIKDLVRKGSFQTKSVPKIIIVSTFHFRGTLDIPMKNRDVSALKNKTSSLRRGRSTRESSSISSKNQTFIETEKALLKYGQFSSLDCSVVEIPFDNRLVSLVVVMPNHHNSTELLLTKLNAQVLKDMINSLVVRKISVEIPVVKFDRGPINVGGLLKELGIDDSFFGDKMQNSETGLNKWMRSSDILHETSIDIGTINPNWSQTEDRLKVGAHDDRSGLVSRKQEPIDSNHMKLDKSFFYFVLDSINGLVLTMGRIRQ